MFLGEYQLKFSGQGRVILPRKLREELGNDRVIILSKGFESCIWGYRLNDWQREAEKQLEVSATEERARLLRRYLFSSSEPVELDSQGRFVIPSALLTFARVKKSVVIIGAGDHFEIWNANNWQKHIARIEKEIKK